MRNRALDFLTKIGSKVAKITCMRAVNRQPWFPRDRLVETTAQPSTRPRIETIISSNATKIVQTSSFALPSSDHEIDILQWILGLKTSFGMIFLIQIISKPFRTDRTIFWSRKTSKIIFFLTFSNFSVAWFRPWRCTISDQRIFWAMSLSKKQDTYFHSILIQRHQNPTEGSRENRKWPTSRALFSDTQTSVNLPPGWE